MKIFKQILYVKLVARESRLISHKILMYIPVVSHSLDPRSLDRCLMGLLRCYYAMPINSYQLLLSIHVFVHFIDNVCVPYKPIVVGGYNMY